MNTSKSFALVGMSGVGKSMFAKVLEGLGHTRISVDEEIERELEPELTKLGYKGIQDVAKWMGFPFDYKYRDNAAWYLALEELVMERVLKRLEAGERLIVDTTGSVVYMDEGILRRLRASAVVVLLEATADHEQALYEQYLAEPKPVIWGDNAYSPEPGEGKMAALQRCYRTLLESRKLRYYGLAHWGIDYRMVRHPEFTVEKFLQMTHANV